MALDFLRRKLREILANLRQDQGADPWRHLFAQHAKGAWRRSDDEMFQGMFLNGVIELFGDLCDKGRFVSPMPIGLLNRAARAAMGLVNSPWALRAQAMSERLILRYLLQESEIRQFGVAVVLKDKSFGSVAGDHPRSPWQSNVFHVPPFAQKHKAYLSVDTPTDIDFHQSRPAFTAENSSTLQEA